MPSLYLHIPFCEVKCGYCDFYSVPRGHEDWDLQKEYVTALLREIDTRCLHFAARQPVNTIFFGGGTPSLLSIDLLEKILKKLSDYFSWSSTTEITLESNPKTVNLSRLKDFRSLGINRLSIGVQSFHDKHLQTLGRFHSAGEATKTIQEAQQAGFENINFDLIFGIPGQTLEEWKSDLKQAVALQTKHLSAYNLTIEEETPFAKIYKTVGANLVFAHDKGRSQGSPLQSEENQIQMFQTTRDFLNAHGFVPYEISNFSKPGFECRHNLNYWNYGEYYGFGVSAASFVGQTRESNIRNLNPYLQGTWRDFSETISPEKGMGEFLFLGLRLENGISLKKFETFFKKSLMESKGDKIQEFLKKEWLILETDSLRLSKKGRLLANELFMELL
ncbi:MAG: radical SAM family heme chaperone HemW [bacterium]|nr:radical SAM family heme chaperone HemW [bacterium]